MNILVIGTGYVGLVSGTCFAEMGHTVTCLDIDETKISHLQQGKVHIFEPGLEELLKRNVDAQRLFFTSDYSKAVKEATVCFIAVGTPMSEDGKANLNYVFSAAESIAQHMNGYTIIVNKSTVPVGTAEQVKKTIETTLKSRNKVCEFDIVSNPEFLKEGDAINDFLKPDRVIIGTNNEKAASIMKEIYSGFTLSHERIMTMSIPSAELTKYASNAMLALRISFMNELSELCETVGADISQIRKGIGTDQRIGLNFLYAGPGFGGSCFPKDLKALSQIAKQNNTDLKITQAISLTNEKQKNRIFQKIVRIFSKQTSPSTLAIWGLAFKPNTDDIRESPALFIIKNLSQQGYTLRLFDPIAQENAKKELDGLKNIIWCDNEYECAKGSDGIILMTEWRQFRLLDLDKVRKLMKGSTFFDTRNQYSPNEMENKGFNYFSIGRASPSAFTHIDDSKLSEKIDSLINEKQKNTIDKGCLNAS